MILMPFVLINLQLELILLDEWFRVNRLSLNLGKSCYIVFHSHNKDITQLLNNIRINGVSIEQVSHTKFLGVHIDEHLIWNQHINVINNKIAKNLGILRKIAYLLPPKILLGLYYTLVNPYLLYGNSLDI